MGFMWPTPGFSTITGKFHEQRKTHLHAGIDISGSGINGTPVYATAAGTVVLTQSITTGYGKNVIVLHSGGISSRYAHLTSYSVKNGQTVAAGQQIGKVGSTGSSTGPHLHFEIRTGATASARGTEQNPFNYVKATSSTAGYGGTASSTTLSDSDLDDSSDSTTTESTEPPHVEQTERVYTTYKEDTPDKGIDDYIVIYKSVSDGKTYDCTKRVTALSLQDDSDEVCTQLSFSIMYNKADQYMPSPGVNVGDMVCVKNRGHNGDSVFLGQVQTKTVSEFECSYEAVDMGFILSKNHIILQSNNLAFKDFLPVIARRLGIEEVSCPNIISSVYGTYKETASDVIKSALDTVTEEVGLKYFIRMKGENILTVQSYGNSVMKFYHKLNANTSSFNVFKDMSFPNVKQSIEDLANEIIVYSEEGNGVTIASDLSNTESINKYGRRIHTESFDSSSTTISAASKAQSLLDEYNKIDSEVSIECYNSDRCVAGVLIYLEHYSFGSGLFWVKAVTHDLIAQTMSLTLEECTIAWDEDYDPGDDN